MKLSINLGSLVPSIPIPHHIELPPPPEPYQPFALMQFFSINDDRPPVTFVRDGDTNIEWRSDGSVVYRGWTSERGHFYEIHWPKQLTKAEKRAVRRAERWRKRNEDGEI